MPVCEPLLAWYDGVRRDLPWRHTRDPYRIWLSEIMLQQTRTETVKAYYARFLTLFPTVADLARASQEQVLKAWEGLGYYSRARNLQKAAQAVIEAHGGAFPASYEGLLSLPGVGPYTAGAVGSIAFGLRVPAVDGNVYRVASRFYGVREDVGRPDVQRRIRERVTADIPAERPGDYNQALMELGGYPVPSRRAGLRRLSMAWPVRRGARGRCGAFARTRKKASAQAGGHGRMPADAESPRAGDAPRGAHAGRPVCVLVAGRRDAAGAGRGPDARGGPPLPLCGQPGAGPSCIHPSGMGNAAVALCPGRGPFPCRAGRLRRPHGHAGGALRLAPAHGYARGGAGGGDAALAPGKAGPTAPRRSA